MQNASNSSNTFIKATIDLLYNNTLMYFYALNKMYSEIVNFTNSDKETA